MSEQNTEITNIISNEQLRRMVVILVVFSLLTVILRLVFQDQIVLSSGDRIWHLSVDISATATDDDLTLKLFPPINTAHIKTIERKVYHPGFQIKKLNNTNKASDRSIAV